MSLVKKLKKKWGIKSNLQLLIIFGVFGITGTTAAWVSNPILEFIGLKKDNISDWTYWIARIIIIFPLYQILLFIIGSLFGQSEFFKNFIKKPFRR